MQPLAQRSPATTGPALVGEHPFERPRAAMAASARASRRAAARRRGTCRRSRHRPGHPTGGARRSVVPHRDARQTLPQTAPAGLSHCASATVVATTRENVTAVPQQKRTRGWTDAMLASKTHSDTPDRRHRGRDADADRGDTGDESARHRRTNSSSRPPNGPRIANRTCRPDREPARSRHVSGLLHRSPREKGVSKEVRRHDRRGLSGICAERGCPPRFSRLEPECSRYSWCHIGTGFSGIAATLVPAQRCAWSGG